MSRRSTAVNVKKSSFFSSSVGSAGLASNSGHLVLVGKLCPWFPFIQYWNSELPGSKPYVKTLRTHCSSLLHHRPLLGQSAVGAWPSLPVTAAVTNGPKLLAGMESGHCSAFPVGHCTSTCTASAPHSHGFLTHLPPASLGKCFWARKALRHHCILVASCLNALLEGVSALYKGDPAESPES